MSGLPSSVVGLAMEPTPQNPALQLAEAAHSLYESSVELTDRLAQSVQELERTLERILEKRLSAARIANGGKGR